MENFSLADEVAKQKLTLQDINEFLTNELKARSLAATQASNTAHIRPCPHDRVRAGWSLHVCSCSVTRAYVSGVVMLGGPAASGLRSNSVMV